MDVLSSLIRRTDEEDPVAGALAMILDSGLVVMTHDSVRRFVQVSGVLGERLTMAEASGTRTRCAITVALSNCCHGLCITRSSGTEQRRIRMLLESHDDHLI
jgi:hypothetical protein